MSEIEVRAEREFFRNGVGIAVFVRHQDGTRSIARPITLESVQEGQEITPTVRLRMAEAQFLMDELWRCGLKPTEGAGSAGQLAATERHLQDMQAIAKGLIKKLGVEL